MRVVNVIRKLVRINIIANYLNDCNLFKIFFLFTQQTLAYGWSPRKAPLVSIAKGDCSQVMLILF